VATNATEAQAPQLQVAASAMDGKLIDVGLLDFDPENPRFLDIAPGSQQADELATKRMVEEENLDELVDSIGQQGFFPGEPLLVTPSANEGRYVVVEGNRRLAALRVLTGKVFDGVLTNSLADAVARASYKPTEVSCFVFAERRDILKYLGFRHISGPRRWEPLSKARYLANLILNFYADLPQEEQIRAVARDIGSRRDYVAQLLTTLNLYNRAREADFYGLQRVREKDISFSLLSTALSYRNIVEFLKLSGRDAVTVEKVDDDHAKELLSWMFAQDQSGDTVLGESRRLKHLAAVVASEIAVTELRRTNDLDQAYLYTSGPSEAFSKLLTSADEALSECIGLLGGDIVPDGSHDALVERIVNRAEDLQILLAKSRRQKSKRARLSEGNDDA
jgi:hypothetical protein